jgi:hypothetical protein
MLSIVYIAMNIQSDQFPSIEIELSSYMCVAKTT